MNFKTVLVLLPTFSQTIEQRTCAGLDDILTGAAVRQLHVPLGYLPAQTDDIESILDVHRLLVRLKPDLVVALGGGLAFKSTPDIYTQVLDVYNGIPIVNIGNKVDGVASVVAENFNGMLNLMHDIIGQRPNDEFIYLSGPQLNQDNKLRFQALSEAFVSQGRDVNDIQVLTGDFSEHVGESKIVEYLKGRPLVPRVIVCANDLSAKGVIKGLRHLNISCPNDIWVTGFDDFEYARSMTPSLTTVHFPARHVGQAAGKLILKLLQNSTASLPTVTEVEGYPVFRESAGKPSQIKPELENNINDHWELIQLRDNNAQQLTLLRELKRSQPLQDLLNHASNTLADLSISHLSLFIRKLNEDGHYSFSELSREGMKKSSVSGEFQLPNEFFQNNSDSYWLLCPMDMGGEQYGVLVAKTEKASAEFVEFITPQFTELLHSEALQERNENYRMQNELNERMAALGTLVSGVAHEVNTPIGTGKLAASSLQVDMAKLQNKMESNTLTRQDFEALVKDAREYSDIIYQSLDRAAELISNFKLVSVDQSAEQKRRIDLGDYINSVLISLRQQLKGTNIKLTADLAEGIIVDTSPGAVGQIITNLFMNAIKHGFSNGAEAGTLTLTLTQEKNGFELIVSDDGKGTSANVLGHIFDPFFTTTRGIGGSGLGMHIVHNLLTQKLNWSIQLESEVGQGFKAIIRGR